MDIPESSIQKFFDYRCSANEASVIAAYLKENQEAYNSVLEDEWNNCESVYVEAEEYIEMRKRIWNKVYKTKRVYITRTVISLAACFILFFCTNVFFKQKQNIKNTLSNENVKSTTAAWNIKFNITDKEEWVHLEDGSDVKLQPNSFIKYQSFTQTNRRDVYLEGEAFFKVAKNKKKPFTVWASGITTTDVGTQFSVAVKGDKVIIKLYEGKVVVRASQTLKGWKRKEIYLSPGMEFVYDKTKASMVVKSFKNNTGSDNKKDNNINDEETVSVIRSANWYMFNNQPLVQVFNQLEEIYNVKIDYKERDFEKVYFIGKFDKNDSVEDILRNITLLKKLKLTRKGNTYTIKK